MLTSSTEDVTSAFDKAIVNAVTIEAVVTAAICKAIVNAVTIEAVVTAAI